MNCIETTVVALTGSAAIGLIACTFLVKYRVNREIAKMKPSRKSKIERLEDKLPRCTCRDVNQCDTWCHAKAMFKKYNG